MRKLSASVVITTFNRAHLVGRAVKSALDQVGPHDDLIVVDDGSTDGTDLVLEPFRTRIRYFRRENAGPSAARNFAMEHSSKDLVLFLDDDDEWYPDKLYLHRELMSARPDVLFSLSSYSRLQPDGSERTRCLSDAGRGFKTWKDTRSPGTPFSSIAPLPPGVADFPVFFGSLFKVLLHQDLVITGLLAVRRNGVPSLPRFSEDIDYCEDWEFCSRLSRLGLCAFLEKDLYRWWEHPGPRMSEQGTFHSSASRLKVLHNVWGQDHEFLKHHGEAFLRAVDKDRLVLVKEYLARGDTKSAAAELDQVTEGRHSLFRFLSRLPKPILLLLLGIRRRLRGGRLQRR